MVYVRVNSKPRGRENCLQTWKCARALHHSRMEDVLNHQQSSHIWPPSQTKRHVTARQTAHTVFELTQTGLSESQPLSARQWGAESSRSLGVATPVWYCGVQSLLCIPEALNMQASLTPLSWYGYMHTGHAQDVSFHTRWPRWKACCREVCMSVAFYNMPRKKGKVQT